MSKKILNLLSEFIPADLSIKSISKISPKLNGFFSAAAAAGYGASEIQKFLRSLTDEAPGRKFQAEKLQKRREAGSISTAEQLELQRLQQEEGESKSISPGLIGAGAGLLSGAFSGEGATPATEVTEATPDTEATAQTQERNQSFFERAMEGVSFFDLDDKVKPNLSKLSNRLDTLERQDVPWNDRSVQKIVRGVRNLVGARGLVDQEEQRFENQAQSQAPQQVQQQGGSADNKMLSILDALSKEFFG